MKVLDTHVTSVNLLLLDLVPSEYTWNRNMKELDTRVTSANILPLILVTSEDTRN